MFRSPPPTQSAASRARFGGTAPSRRGVTIIEMVVAMGVAMIILASAYILYRENRLLLEKPRTSFSVQDDLMAAMRWLERDLSETNLMSVRAFPNAANPDEPPGLSLISPRRRYDEALVVSEYGGVRWQKYVYYTLEPVDGVTGNLVRIEGNLTDQSSPLDGGHRMPMPSGMTPSRGGDSTTRRVVAHNVLLTSPQIPAGAPVMTGPGFSAALRTSNGVFPLQGTALTDGAVQVDLRVYALSTVTGRPSALVTQLVVTPRN